MTFTRRETLAVRDVVRRALLNGPATSALVTRLHAAYERAAALGPLDPLIGGMVRDAIEAYAAERANNIAQQVDEAIDEVRREEEAGR